MVSQHVTNHTISSSMRVSTSLAVGLALLTHDTARAETADAGPAFDCSAATLPAEKTICDDWQLGWLDLLLSTLFAAAPANDARRGEQKTWIERRNECRSDRSCIKEAYLVRLRAFQSQPKGIDIGGTYDLAQPGDSGTLLVVPSPNGASVLVDLAMGPTFHLCRYTGSLVSSEDYVDMTDTLLALTFEGRELLPSNSEEACHVRLSIDGTAARLTSERCEEYCGARARLDGSFYRRD